MGVGKFYKRKNRFLITLDALSGLLFYSILILLLILKFEVWFVAAIFVLRLIVQTVIYPKIFKKLAAADLVWWFPILDALYYFYLNIFGFVGLLTKNVKWK